MKLLSPLACLTNHYVLTSDLNLYKIQNRRTQQFRVIVLCCVLRWKSSLHFFKRLLMCNLHAIWLRLLLIICIFLIETRGHKTYPNRKHYIAYPTEHETEISVHKTCWKCPPLFWICVSVLLTLLQEICVTIFVLMLPLTFSLFTFSYCMHLGLFQYTSVLRIPCK
jgi:hypothetical protein